MARKTFCKKPKKIKSFAERAFSRAVIPSYLACIIAAGGAALAVMFAVDSATAIYCSAIAFFLFFFLLSGGMYFAVMPAVRKKQAELDLKNYDFSPCVLSDKERFFSRIPLKRFYFTPDLFDGNESVLLRGKEATDAYLEQFSGAEERYLGAEILKDGLSFEPFFINDWDLTHESNTFCFAEKRTEADKTSVTLSLQYELIFREDGVYAQEKLFTYDQIQAMFDCVFFNHTGVSAKVFLHLGDEMTACFAVGGTIAALLDKYGVCVENREEMLFTLSHPEQAFLTVARRGKLKLKQKA